MEEKNEAMKGLQVIKYGSLRLESLVPRLIRKPCLPHFLGTHPFLVQPMDLGDNIYKIVYIGGC